MFCLVMRTSCSTGSTSGSTSVALVVVLVLSVASPWRCWLSARQAWDVEAMEWEGDQQHKRPPPPVGGSALREQPMAGGSMTDDVNDMVEGEPQSCPSSSSHQFYKICMRRHVRLFLSSTQDPQVHRRVDLLI